VSTFRTADLDGQISLTPSVGEFCELRMGKANGLNPIPSLVPRQPQATMNQVRAIFNRKK
jgi:hypothetical protein